MKAHHCPNCQRVLYDRRLTHCGYCGAMIPESLRFTEEKIAAMDQEMAELQEESLERERAAEKEANEGLENGLGYTSTGYPGSL